jgi:hypothetical protein
VVVVEFPEGGRGRAVLDSTVGSNSGAGAGAGAVAGGAATVVVVAIEGETGSASFITECIPTGSESGSSSS